MADLFTATGKVIAKPFSKGGLQFITGYKYAEYSLQAINGMTFFYDPKWFTTHSTASEATFPIAFFHLKSIHEVMESEVQTKTMLFYNSQKTVNENAVSGSITNIVADNIINKPKSYRLDVIVPYDNLTMLFDSSILNAYQASNVTNFISGKNLEGTVNFLAKTTNYVSLLKDLLNSLWSTGGTDISSVFTSIMETPSYNKNSLEAMWKNRTVLKLKLWNGWRFKYVVITNIDITKESTEYGVEEASITCTEIPMVFMKTKKEYLSKVKSLYAGSWLIQKSVDLFVKTMEKIRGDNK